MRKLLYIIITVAVAGIASLTFALTVSPPRVDITGDPGATLKGEIELFNEQGGERIFYTSFENFEPSGDSGAPHFIGAKDGLATWIKAEKKVVLGSGKRSVVPYSITIPKNAEPGGHFAAIFFGSQEPGVQGGGQVSVGGKIGVLILLRVSGDVEEGGGLLEFVTKEKKRFFTSLPVVFTYRINNTGGDRVVPLGEIKIKNTLQFTSAKLLANKNEGSVLPGSARKFEVPWGQEVQSVNNTERKTGSLGFFDMAGRQWSDFHFGWYTAKLNLSWGVTNQTANASYNFFVIPWQLLIIFLIVIAILGFLAKIGLRKYNRWIISKAQRSSGGIQRNKQ
ncbi:MAG: hypothetical protein EXS50_02700 [Candidatus Taylorbacteria bacterium]|nr:hypothetical protein [Candidatus Taylorbacteria bacterium]